MRMSLFWLTLGSERAFSASLSFQDGLGTVWDGLGRWRSGTVWGALERSGALWGALGRSGTVWGDLGRSGAVWDGLGGRSGAVWDGLGRSWAVCDGLGRSAFGRTCEP